MRELAGRLDALDPDAGSALRAVAYFDELVAGRAGLESVVRGAAILSGHPARLVDDDRGVRMRITPDGIRRDAATSPSRDWCHFAVESGATLWLEYDEPPGPVEAVVLERAAHAVWAVLDRTRSRIKVGRHDPSLIELVLDGSAPLSDRVAAARRLGLDETKPACVVATTTGRLDIVACPDPDSVPRRIVDAAHARVGVGPAKLPQDLPGTELLARTAARFTAEGDGVDPGPRVVFAERLGGLLLLAVAVDSQDGVIPDVAAVERAANAAPWVLTTLDAVATSVSVRAAASRLQVHHSTLQGRTLQIERWLGWSPRDEEGRTRLYVALHLRRLYRNGREH